MKHLCVRTLVYVGARVLQVSTGRCMYRVGAYIALAGSSETDFQGVILSTFHPKSGDITRKWYVIDATDVVLGRLATQAAILLRGKNKPTYAPHADSGNHVIIINADKIALTGNKMGKELYSHSGRPGGLRRDSYAELLEKNPERIIKNAVKGMLPKNRLAKVQLDRLRIFRGAEHPHTPQKPQVFEIAQVSQQAK